MSKKLPKIVVIVGPTASGKTGVGIALAKQFGGEVVSADSRTVYKGMDIGTAKPPEDKTAEHPSLPVDIRDVFAEQPYMVQGVPHWGFNLVNPEESFSVAEYQKYADKKIAEIIRRGKVPIVVGGTGLYIRALLDRPNFAGAAPNEALRAELEALTDDELRGAIEERDPDALQILDVKNRRRLVRALEILRTTDGVLADRQEFGQSVYDALQLGMRVPREELYARIDLRVDEMVATGLVDEVRVLLEKYGADLQAMSGIGYRQIAGFFAKAESLREAVVRIKIDTRHYAKRQETWFMKDRRILWVASAEEAAREAEEFLKKI